MALITIINGGTGPGDFTSDENNAALALTMGIPLAFYSIWYSTLTKKQEYFRWVVVVLLLAATVATGSRGGFLGLVAALGLIWWFSKNRLKVAAWGATVAIVGGGFVISLLPSVYVADLRSITDTQDSTRVERLNTWEVAWIMYKDNPVLGVGAGNFYYNAGKYQRQASWWTEGQKSLQGRVTHSIYFQVLSELGSIGALIYMYIMFVLTSKLYRLRNRSRHDTEDDRFLELLCQTLIVSMGTFAVSGAFLSAAYYPHIPIWITMYAIVMRFGSSLSGRVTALPACNNRL